MDASYIFQGLAGGLGGLTEGLREKYMMQRQLAEAAEAKRRWEEEMGMRQDTFEATQTQNQWERSNAEKQQAEAARRFQQEMDMRRSQQQAEEFRSGMQEMRLGGAGAGLNYLNPKRAYQFQQLNENPVQLAPELGGARLQVGQPGQVQKILGGIDPLSKQLSAQNRGTGMLPGSEPMGGVVLENRQFNPYAGRGGSGGGDNLTREVTRLQTEARRRADVMKKLRLDAIPQIQQQYGVEAAAKAAAEAETAYEAEMQKAMIAAAATIQAQFPSIPFETIQRFFQLSGGGGMGGGGGGRPFPMPPTPGQSPATPAPGGMPQAPRPFPEPAPQNRGGPVMAPQAPRPFPAPPNVRMSRDTIHQLFPQR